MSKADQHQWALSVLQATDTAGKFGGMRMFWPADDPAGLDAQLAMLATELDINLARITGELRDDRTWLIGESLLTPREWAAAIEKDRDDHRFDWHVRRYGIEVCKLDGRDCPYLRRDEEE